MQFAMNIRTDVRIVISLVSRVSDEFNAPYGTLINVYSKVIEMYVTYAYSNDGANPFQKHSMANPDSGIPTNTR